MKRPTDLSRSLLLRALGITFCTVPVIACILSYFPLWIERSDNSTLSGFSLLLFALALIPFYKSIKRLLTSPASYTVWMIVFIVFFILSRIADEMTVISFVGFVGNVIGALFFKLAEKYREGKTDEGQL